MTINNFPRGIVCVFWWKWTSSLKKCLSYILDLHVFFKTKSNHESLNQRKNKRNYQSCTHSYMNRHFSDSWYIYYVLEICIIIITTAAANNFIFDLLLLLFGKTKPNFFFIIIIYVFLYGFSVLFIILLVYV